MAKTHSAVRVHPESRLAPENRVFVNRNLRMANIAAIGFDLDHTLAHYRGPAVEELAYDLTRRRLVEQYDYPAELLELPYDRKFVIRGLVIDKRRGNIVKMDYHNYVARGYHGFTPLEPEARKLAYGKGRIRAGSGAYVSVDTLFHLPEVFLFVALVDLLEKRPRRKGGRRRSYRAVYDHVRQSIDSVHGDGSLKKEILADLDRFIRRDPRLYPTLREFRRAGKKLFLLTNSEYYYSDAILGYLLANGNGSRDWRELFQLIVVDAGKPAYFTDLDRPPVGEEGEGPCPIVHGGNARLLENALGFRGDQILYFGDHTYGDILRSKKTLGWRTAMVVEELRRELEVSRRVRPNEEELTHWRSLRSVLEADASALEVESRRLARRLETPNGSSETRERMERRRDSLLAQLQELEEEKANVRRTVMDLGEGISSAHNKHWGPIFREGQEMSRFAHQVKDFACIYMPRVSNLLYYDANHYFRSAAERMPHEMD